MLLQNTKKLVQLAKKMVKVMSADMSEDPVIWDIRNVAELHLAEITEAWQGVTSAEDLNDIVLFSSKTPR